MSNRRKVNKATKRAVILGPEGKPVRCSRCGATPDEEVPKGTTPTGYVLVGYATAGEGWNVVYSGGRVTGHLCPGCQTGGESVEAEVNDTLTDYSGWHQLTDPHEVARAMVEDLVHRVEREWAMVCRRVAETGETLIGGDAEDEVLERVLGKMPAHWRDAYRGAEPFPERIRSIVRDVLTGAIYEDPDPGGEPV